MGYWKWLYEVLIKSIKSEFTKLVPFWVVIRRLKQRGCVIIIMHIFGIVRR